MIQNVFFVMRNLTDFLEQIGKMQDNVKIRKLVYLFYRILNKTRVNRLHVIILINS